LWLAAEHSPDQLRRWALDDDEAGCLPFDQFVGELEAIVKGKKKRLFARIRGRYEAKD